MPEWFEPTVGRQLAIVPQTWAALEEHGVAGQALRLDFAYAAPTEDSAGRLLAFLRLSTDYEVDVEVAPAGEAAAVVGMTHPAALSIGVLEDWVRWIATAGAEYGGCRLTGWGVGVGG